MGLVTDANFRTRGGRGARTYEPGDDFYEALTVAQAGLSDEASAQFIVRLAFLLANHVGDMSVLKEAIDAARRGL